MTPASWARSAPATAKKPTASASRIAIALRILGPGSPAISETDDRGQDHRRQVERVGQRDRRALRQQEVAQQAAAEPAGERQAEHADEVEALLPARAQRAAGRPGGDAEQVDETKRVLSIHGSRMGVSRADVLFRVPAHSPQRKLPMAVEQKLEIDGEVTEALPNLLFRVKLENDHELLAHLAGKMRRFRIRVLPGDKVRVEVSPYDLNRGRIVYRYK